RRRARGAELFAAASRASDDDAGARGAARVGARAHGRAGSSAGSLRGARARGGAGGVVVSATTPARGKNAARDGHGHQDEEAETDDVGPSHRVTSRWGAAPDTAGWRAAALRARNEPTR